MDFRKLIRMPAAFLSASISRSASQGFLRGVSPIAIGGCARSGTTLLLSVLSSHPRICAIPFETQALCPTAYDPHPNWDADLEVTAIHDYLSTVAAHASRCQYWCEKTPKNVLFFERILTHLGPSARLFNVVRDGRDVVCSIHPDDPSGYWVSPQRWVEDVEAGLAFEGHPQVLTVRYEDFVTCFRETSQIICDFLNLDYTYHLERYPAYAQLKNNNAWFSTAHAPTTGRIGRWRAKAMRNRVDELLADSKAVRLLRHFDYL